MNTLKPRRAPRLSVVLFTLALSGCGMAASGVIQPSRADTPPRPNILWLTCEDMSPNIGPYGDRYATTPNLDRFAGQSLRYETVWSNAPVCAPARTTLISGLYPPSTGGEHMRSMVRLPAAFKMYPQVLREAGYYCTNNSKTDYNLEEPGVVWDASSARAHWKNRPAGQPFFAVFNFLITHESQIRTRPHTWVHDPAKAPLPAYHPDTPEVRQDWAQYYDNITTMDAQVGEKLKELDDAGLADNTIVFFYSDHGSGMPRSKRWPYNSGLQVPLLIRIPEKFHHLAPKDYAPGATTKRPVSFVDMAPTLMSLAGVQPPAYLQGHAFAGKYETPAQTLLHGFRGRMDERYDLVRSVRDQRYVYIRNYMPHRIYGQHIGYMFETPTTRVWKERYDAGQLKAPQTYFWQTKPVEELYDLQSDPDEVKNLAADPQHRQTLERLRQAQRDQALRIRDIGFLPEGEIHSRAQGSTPYEMGHDPAKYPFERVFAAAELASRPEPKDRAKVIQLLQDSDSAVRFWGATGLLIRGQAAVVSAHAELRRALADASPYVVATAAEALGKYGDAQDLELSLTALRSAARPDGTNVYARMATLVAIDELGKKAAPLLPLVKQLNQPLPGAPARTREYPTRLVESIVANLEK
jgi:uncharacterized sulfatase